ncbi:MAG: TVP38/TMEM64 family protein [Phycisphaerae bacterium]|nr:TVP38/TMEM64 family protein [Phycisphaerae bacterium]
MDQSSQPILKRLGFASVLAVVAVVLPPLGGFLVLGYMDTIAQWLDSHREYGPAVYACAFAVLAGLALLPTYAQAILGGWAFGIAGGFPAALVGFFGGSLIGYAVARPTASERVTRVIDEQPKWAAVRDALVPAAHDPRHGSLRTLGIVTLLRLPPNSPFAITNLVLASVRVPLWIYSVGTIVGMAPRTLAAVWLGDALHGQFASIREGLSAPKPWWLFAAMIAGTVVVLGIIGVIANKAVERVTRPRSSA